LKKPASNPNTADSGTIRHFYLKPAGDAAAAEFAPRFYLEAKIDLSDVRSGLRESLSVNRALELILLEGDVLWTEDMVQAIDPDVVESGLPPSPRLKPLPPNVDAACLRSVENQFLSYLLRHFEVRIFRNPILRLYSLPVESKDDFRARCLETLARPFRADLDNIRELCDRKLERVKLRYLRLESGGGFAEERISAEARNWIHEMSERVEELFVRAELTSEPAVGNPMFPHPADGTLEQRLALIESEAREAIRRLADEYTEIAGQLDEYLVRPSLKDIRLGGVSILWMPVRV
jgi:hypothetical protein